MESKKLQNINVTETSPNNRIKFLKGQDELKEQKLASMQDTQTNQKTFSRSKVSTPAVTPKYTAVITPRYTPVVTPKYSPASTPLNQRAKKLKRNQSSQNLEDDKPLWGFTNIKRSQSRTQTVKTKSIDKNFSEFLNNVNKM